MILRKKVLVVEDNELNRTLLSEILSGEYQVLEAENGQAALDILKQHKDSIALILLDVRMPVMDGYIFLDKLHIQLQNIQCHLTEHIQRRVSASKIIHFNDKSQSAQLLYCTDNLIRVVCVGTLCNLQMQTGRINAVLLNQP